MTNRSDKTARQKWSRMSSAERQTAIRQAMKDAYGYGTVESVIGGQVEPDAPCSPLRLAYMI